MVLYNKVYKEGECIERDYCLSVYQSSLFSYQLSARNLELLSNLQPTFLGFTDRHADELCLVSTLTVNHTVPLYTSEQETISPLLNFEHHARNTLHTIDIKIINFFIYLRG